MSIEEIRHREDDVFDRERLNWSTTLVMGVFHIGAVAALFFTNWRAVAVAAFLYWMTIGLGISMGYHRLHTHRSYRVPQDSGILLCAMWDA